MTALVRPPCTTSVTDGLCVFPYFAVPHSIIRYQRVKCSSPIPRARATCTAHILLNMYTVMWSDRSERPAARAAVRAVRSGPLVIVIRCANNTVPGKAEGGQNDRCLKALTGPSGRGPPAR